MTLSATERYLQDWHRRHPDGTRVFSTLHGSDGRSSYDRLADRVAAAEAVLDVACGAGTLLERIAVRAPRRCLVGIDLSAPDLQLARAAVPSGHFAVARAQALPLPAASMDAVTCHLALMLMDDPGGVVSEMRRVLRPGGALQGVVVNPIGFDPAVGRIIQSLAAAGANRPETRPPSLGDPRTFTVDGLRSLLHDGFDGIEIEQIVVKRAIPRAELWEFLEQSVYGLDHLSTDEAQGRLEQLGLPSQLSWQVPLLFAAARARR